MLALSDDIIVDSFTNRPSANCSLMCLWGCIQRKVLDDTRVYFEQLLFASTDLGPGLPSFVFACLSRISFPGQASKAVGHTRWQTYSISQNMCFRCHRAFKRLCWLCIWFLGRQAARAWAVVEAPGDILLDCYQGQRTTNIYKSNPNQARVGWEAPSSWRLRHWPGTTSASFATSAKTPWLARDSYRLDL